MPQHKHQLDADTAVGMTGGAALATALCVSAMILPACGSPTAPSVTLRVGSYLLTIVTDRRSDGTRSCVADDGVAGVAFATSDTAVRLDADGAGFRGIAASSAGGTVNFAISLLPNGSSVSVNGTISGTAIAISPVPGTAHPDELAFGTSPDGPASLLGTAEKSGIASGRLSGGLTYTFFDPLRVYPCHNTNTSWTLTPQ